VLALAPPPALGRTASMPAATAPPLHNRTQLGVEFFREHEAFIAGLPVQLRRLAELRSCGRTYKEIEAATGLPFNSVGNYLARARAQLRLLAAGEPAPPPAARPPAFPLVTTVVPPPDVEGDVLDPPAVARLRRKMHRGTKDGRVRAKTIPMPQSRGEPHLPRNEQRLAALMVYPDDVDRPQTRGDCENMPRPCPFVSCAHHLYLDVSDETGSIKLNFPHLEPWEMGETCSLDVADRGGITLEEVGAILNLTRERIRQIEVRGLETIKRYGDAELGLPAARDDGFGVNMGPVRRHRGAD
jgi:DNA-directed RNA polymerase specialized sigma24 family protein